jgi:hypothetical protein
MGVLTDCFLLEIHLLRKRNHEMCFFRKSITTSILRKSPADREHSKCPVLDKDSGIKYHYPSNVVVEGIISLNCVRRAIGMEERIEEKRR